MKSRSNDWPNRPNRNFTIVRASSATIEQRAASEVTPLFGVNIAPDEIGAENPAFDVTPARYVTAIITEHGVGRAPYEEPLKRLAQRAKYKLHDRAGFIGSDRIRSPFSENKALPRAGASVKIGVSPAPAEFKSFRSIRIVSS
jgi:hypothetical protein